jgi:membrane-bound metal-dependent hydrolase YbcI (DUF457 family)
MIISPEQTLVKVKYGIRIFPYCHPGGTLCQFQERYGEFQVVCAGCGMLCFPGYGCHWLQIWYPLRIAMGSSGFSHSLFFALCLASFLIIFHRQLRPKPWAVFWLCFVSCVSHAFLDAMTNGGLGVALYWPFSSGRIFLPFRPIQVSPIGVGSFFTEWGLRVFASELIWVLIPALVIGTIAAVIRRKYVKK